MIVHQNDNSRGNYNFNLVHYENLKIPPHFHRSLELVFVSSGEIIVSAGEREACFRAGDYALILSNQIHAFRTEGSSQCWIAVFSEDFVPKFASLIKNKQGSTAKFCLGESTHAFVQRQLTEGPSSVLMKKACFYAVCDEYLAQVTLSEKRSSDIKVGAILDYIAQNYREDLTLERVAKEFGYEYHYLSRLLSQCYHIRFRDVLNEYRVEAAKELLSAGGHKMTDLALECGFQSIRSFNHVFKTLTGCAPKDYLHFSETPTHPFDFGLQK